MQKEDFQVFENLKAEVVVKGRKGTFSEDNWLNETKPKAKQSHDRPSEEKRRASKLTPSTIHDEDDIDDIQKMALRDGFIDDREYIVDKMYGLIRSKPISLPDKAFMIQLIQEHEHRMIITEVLNDINAPK